MQVLADLKRSGGNTYIGSRIYRIFKIDNMIPHFVAFVKLNFLTKLQTTGIIVSISLYARLQSAPTGKE